jgi:hypothetical protein
MTNYTKGNWVYDKTSGGIKAMNIRAANNSPMVANVFVTDIDDQTETDANAYLIASAPDLYEALKEAKGLLDWIWSDNIIKYQIEKALAKAECKELNSEDKDGH